jgi:polysaccharide pyruvyl transferase WcaK-like protein
MYLAIGAGPIVHPLSRRLMRFAVAQADFCSYRDEGSRRFMASIGRQTDRDEIWPDLVFAMDRKMAPTRTAGPFTVALGVMNYRGWRGFGTDADRTHDRYLERMTALAEALLAKGYALRLVIGEDTDLTAARTVEARLRDPSVEVLASADLDDVRSAVMTQVDVLISSRYHNLVAALLAGVPAVSLGYADKNDQLLDAFGLGEYCQHIETFAVDLVLQHVDAIQTHRAGLVAELRRRVALTRAEVNARLDQQLGETAG